MNVNLLINKKNLNKEQLQVCHKIDRIIRDFEDIEVDIKELIISKKQYEILNKEHDEETKFYYGSVRLFKI